MVVKVDEEANRTCDRLAEIFPKYCTTPASDGRALHPVAGSAMRDDFHLRSEREGFASGVASILQAVAPILSGVDENDCLARRSPRSKAAGALKARPGRRPAIGCRNEDLKAAAEIDSPRNGQSGAPPVLANMPSFVDRRCRTNARSESRRSRRIPQLPRLTHTPPCAVNRTGKERQCSTGG